MSRSDGGAGNSISSVGLCRVFNLLALWALPLYSLTETQGERLRCIPLSPLLRFYTEYPAMLRDTSGGEEAYPCHYRYRYYLTLPSLRATSPIFCCAKHRKRDLMPFYLIIYRMRWIVFVLLPCRVQWHCGELCKQYREETEETVVPEERA